MNTIQKLNRSVQYLATTYIPKKLHPRFLTGIQALATQPLDSLNSNGRNLDDNRWTGESRIRRAVTDGRFPLLILIIILKEFVPRTGRLRLSLDHTTLGNVTLAVFALSLGKGRALPIWCVVTRTGKGHPLLRPLLKGFKVILSHMSYAQRKRIVVVMDRWFAIPTLLEWLDSEHISFVVRLKANTSVGVPWQAPHLTVPVGEISLPDTPVTYHGHDWRVVRSDVRPNMKVDEPWFLLTNIPPEKMTRQQVLRTYAKRFEIEECFKDVKWVERYEWHRIRKLSVAHTVYMFVFLGWWLLLYAHTHEAINKTSTRHTHPKKRLSWFRAIWEWWQRVRIRPLYLSP